MAHPHIEIMRAADEAMRAGDVDGYWGAHTDDVIAHVSGSNALAGTYKGKGEVLELFERFMERTPGFTFEVHDYLANDEHGIGLQHSHYERGDERLDSNDTWICHFRDGKISEFWFIPEDQDAVDRFIG